MGKWRSATTPFPGRGSSAKVAGVCHICQSLERGLELSVYRPGQASRAAGVFVAPGISRQSAHEGGKVITCRLLPTLAPGNIPGTHFS
jgi:hypothetical protein